jgi:hypothetical protein
MDADVANGSRIEDYYRLGACTANHVTKLPNEGFESAHLQQPMETYRFRLPKGILMITSPVLARTRISPRPGFVFSRA